MEKRFYSVLPREEIRKNMTKEIDQISEVFLLSSSTATVILLSLRWDSQRAMERLSVEKEKFLAELGIFDSVENEFNSSFAGLEIKDSNVHGDDLVSTPFCSHKFDSTRWRDYLNESLQKQEKRVISCPNEECKASVGSDTTEKLPEEVQKMYESYVLASFMESQMEPIKLCPAPGCNFAIKRLDERYSAPCYSYTIKPCDNELGDDDDELEYDDGDDDHDDLEYDIEYALEEGGDEEEESSDFGVVCLCGHIFCWTCQQESHLPVTCKTASIWLNRLDQAKSLTWIAANTKPCPDCNYPLEKTGDSKENFLTCICSYHFCWICSRTKEDHRNCYEVSVPLPDHVSNLTHSLKLWDETDEAMENAKSKLKNSIPKLIETYGLSEQDIKSVKEAGMLVVQCRLVLKWSYVFDYFFNEYLSSKKLLLADIRDQALTGLYKHEENLDELMMNQDQAFILLKHRLGTTKRTTGKYFRSLVNAFEDALSGVEVDGSENDPMKDQFCDECTFKNSWSDAKCKMCRTAFVYPSDVAATASDHHHQEVPNMPNGSIESDESNSLIESAES